MTCLRYLTNKFLALAALFALGGCHGAPPPRAPMLVYANLNALAQHHPGWVGVGLYNQMAARLETSVRQAQRGVDLPMSPLGLSAMADLALPNGAFALPQATLSQQRLLLEKLEREQIARLEQRRAAARALEIRAQMRAWRRDARQQYEQTVAAIRSEYSAGYLDTITQNGIKRLNLTLQVRALEQNIADWSLAKPPAPHLAEARQELAADQKELALLASEQTEAVEALRRQRDLALVQAAEARTAFLAKQEADMSSRLAEADSAAVAAQRALLAKQTERVISGEQRLIAAAVPTAGTLGKLALAGSLRAAAPETGTREVEARLLAQRDRWIRNIYGDTQAAAEDAARQRGWKVTFGKRLPGEPDRTAVLAALLASHVWKS